MPIDFYSGIYGDKLKRQPVAKSQKDVVWDNQKGKCYFCRSPLSPSHTHYDHIKEVYRGGKSKTKNLRAVCANCHSDRHKQDAANKADKRRTKKNNNLLGFGNDLKVPKINPYRL